MPETILNYLNLSVNAYDFQPKRGNNIHEAEENMSTKTGKVNY
jgi:hypothetical protein